MSVALRWAALVALSAAIAALLQLTGLPAALLLGPMAAGIILAVRGHAVDLPDPVFLAAQTLLGCLIASAMTAGIAQDAMREWPIFAAATLATVLVSAGLGFALAMRQVLPGTAAIWGSMPGMSTTMILMAREAGADYRLVAFMTYARVIVVAVVASLLALAIGGRGGGHGAAVHHAWFGPIDARGALVTLAICVAGLFGGRLARLPAPAILGPLVLGTALNMSPLGPLDFALPGWLLAIAYAAIGWRIGLRFTAETIAAAGRALPSILFSSLLLVAFCAGIGGVLVVVLGVDPVTAYLATSPGGMDSAAIIAASSKVDLPFVMALQLMRLVMILLCGPALVRFAARRFEARRAA